MGDADKQTNEPNNSYVEVEPGGQKRPREPETAWEAVWQQYDSVRETFPDRPTFGRSELLLDQLTVNSLAPDPQGGKIMFRIPLNSDKGYQRVNLKAALVQACGIPFPEPCTYCARHRGVWGSCIGAPASCLDVLNGACACCFYDMHSSRCSHRSGVKVRRQSRYTDFGSGEYTSVNTVTSGSPTLDTSFNAHINVAEIKAENGVSQDGLETVMPANLTTSTQKPVSGEIYSVSSAVRALCENSALREMVCKDAERMERSLAEKDEEILRLKQQLVSKDMQLRCLKETISVFHAETMAIGENDDNI